MKQPANNKLTEIKNNLVNGDHEVIRRRMQQTHGLSLSLSTIRRALNPKQDYFHELIYTEALKLSVERKKAKSDNAGLEAQL